SSITRAPRGPWETVPVRTNDEVGELATAFNQMIARLESARTDLERRVAEATRNITTLYEVARTTTSTLEIEDVLELVAEKTLATLGLGGSSSSGIRPTWKTSSMPTPRPPVAAGSGWRSSSRPTSSACAPARASQRSSPR